MPNEAKRSQRELKAHSYNKYLSRETLFHRRLLNVRQPFSNVTDSYVCPKPKAHIHRFFKLTRLIPTPGNIYGQRTLFWTPNHKLSYNRQPHFTGHWVFAHCCFYCALIVNIVSRSINERFQRVNMSLLERFTVI